jgi:hypothetical protein
LTFSFHWHILKGTYLVTPLCLELFGIFNATNT